MEIIEPVIYISLSQTFFAGLLIATKRPSDLANKLMAALMFLIFFDLLFVLVKIKIIQFYSFPFIAFTYGPIVYLYVGFMTDRRRRFDWINLLHFIPFIAFFVLSVIYRRELTFTNLTDFFRLDDILSLRIIYAFGFFTSITVYSILTFVAIGRHQRSLKDSVSYTSGVITLNWLKIVSISFYLSYFCLFILGGIDLTVNFIPFDPYYTVFVFVAVMSFVYSFYVIRQPLLVGAIAHSDENGGYNGNRGMKERGKGYDRSGISAPEAEGLLADLIDYMVKEKPYLNRDLTITLLSEQVGIPRHHITELLNEYHGRNFFLFINEYRVSEVIERLNDPANDNFTILAIAYDAGFNSKSTFNSIFKAKTGRTPRDYRAMVMASR